MPRFALVCLPADPHTLLLHCICTLYCLQWPGVYCMTAEEEEAAEAGLKAAGRASSGLVELQLCGLEFAVR
jgi:hypothetical protein